MNNRKFLKLKDYVAKHENKDELEELLTSNCTKVSIDRSKNFTINCLTI